MFNSTSSTNFDRSTIRSAKCPNESSQNRRIDQNKSRLQHSNDQINHQINHQNQLKNYHIKNRIQHHHFSKAHPFRSNRSNLLNHLKSNLMFYKGCLIFIFIIAIHLSCANASNDLHSNDNRIESDTSGRINSNDKLNDDLTDLIEQEDKIKDKTFLNEFAIELDASTCPANADCKAHLDEKANRLADKHGFVNHGQVSYLSLF